MVQHHVGETVTSLQRVALGPGCSEVLLYTTIMGGVGALLPLTAKDDLELVQALEMHLRQENPPLSGRDQLFFRSAYFPVKGVIDGDFCAGFNSLPADEQRAIAEGVVMATHVFSNLDRKRRHCSRVCSSLCESLLSMSCFTWCSPRLR